MANISKINFTGRNYTDNKEYINIGRIDGKDIQIIKKQSTKNPKIYTITLPADEFVCSKTKSRKKPQTANNLAFIKLAGAFITALGLATQTPKAVAFITQDNKPVVVELGNVESENEYEFSESIAPSMKQDEYCEFIKEAMMEEAEKLNEAQLEEAKEIEEQNFYAIQGQQLIDDILENDEFSTEHLRNLRNSFNNELSDLEIASNLVYLCNSPQWGNGCIDPLVFYAQLCQESDCESDAVGDYSKDKEIYLAHGFGQFHTCAVDEVNNQIELGRYGDFTYNNGLEYTYEDRKDPQKALEMMMLLLRYDSEMTDSTESMLAMYNRGHKNGINTMEGKEYVAKVYGRIGREY